MLTLFVGFVGVVMVIAAWHGEPLLTTLLAISIYFSMLLPLSASEQAMAYGIAISIIHSLIQRVKQ